MPEQLDGRAVEDRLAAELLKIHCESHGKGARDARAYILDDLVVCLLDGIELLPNEEFMVGEGKGDAVVDVRRHYQQAIETTFRAAVERATGRRVISFASNTKLDDPHYEIETFRLGPVTEPEPGEPR